MRATNRRSGAASSSSGLGSPTRHGHRSPTQAGMGLRDRRVEEIEGTEEDEEVGSNRQGLDNDSDSDNDEDDSTGKYRSKTDTVKLYVLSVLVVLLFFGYMYEREQKVQFVREFNEKMDGLQYQVMEARNKLGASKAAGTFGGSGNSAAGCPICNKCPDPADVPLTEEEKPITETDEILASWKLRDDAIVGELQNLARDVLILKYGPPPYYVEFNVEIAPDRKAQGGRLVFEMAPIELMPYSILYFLNQVSSHVWDQCSFFINLGVVFLDDARGGPTCNKEAFRPQTEYSTVSREFLAFQEYSGKYRHEELTLGISGRPGGLGVYISAQNNTKQLGPRGDYTPGAPPLAADPTIGKLIRGSDVYVRLKKIESQVEGETSRLFLDISGFINAVTISSAKIIGVSEL